MFYSIKVFVFIEAQTSQHSELSARLRRWKEERTLRKKIEDARKKPVFKVGIVHHNFYSPVRDKVQKKTQRCHPRAGQKEKAQPTPPKRITRATQKRLEAKNLASALSSATNSKSKVSPKPLRPVRQKKRLSSARKVSIACLGESFAPANYTFTAPRGVQEIPMFGRVAIPSKDDSFCMPSPLEFDLKTAVSKPWPTLESMTNNTGQSLRKMSELKRQNAIECSSDTSSPVENKNSSTDFCLRLSSESGTFGEAVAEDDPLLVSDINKSHVTPPRSGSPVPASFSPYIVTSRGKDSARKEQKNRMGIRRSSTTEIPTKDTVMQSLNISVEEEEQTAQYFKFLLHRETDRLNDLCAKWDVVRTDPNLSEDAACQIVAAIGQTKLLMRKKFERFQSLIHDCETGKGQMLVGCKDLGGFWDLTDREIKDCDARFSKLDFLKAHDWIEEKAVVKKVTKKNPAPAKPKINVKSSARSWILAARKKKMEQEAGLVVQEFVGNAPSTSRTTKSPKEPERRRRISTPQTLTSLLQKVQLSEASKNVTSPLAIMKVTKMFKTPEVKLDDTISYVNSDKTPAKGILKKSEGSSSSESCPPRSSRKVDFNDDVFLEDCPAAEIDEALQNSLDLGRALARIDSYDSDDSVDPRDPTPKITARTAEKRLDFENESFGECVTHGGRRRSIPTISVETPKDSPRRITRSTKENADPQKESASEFSNGLRTDRDNKDPTKRRRSTRRSVQFNREY